MEVKIGIQHAARELVLESDVTADEIEAQLAQAVSNDSLLTLSDAKGRRVVVPASRIAYVECGSPRPGTVGYR